LNNPWISGFTDAEGCFSIINRKDREKFYLTYKIGNNNEPYIIQHLKKLFLGAYQKDNHFIFQAASQETLGVLISYFERFPLKTEKTIPYKRWKKLYYRQIDGKVRTGRALNRLDRLKKSLKKDELKIESTKWRSFK